MTPALSMQLATELRDTILQDLVAVSMMVKFAQAKPETSDKQVLQKAESILRTDLDQLRLVISRLGPPA